MLNISSQSSYTACVAAARGGTSQARHACRLFRAVRRPCGRPVAVRRLALHLLPSPLPSSTIQPAQCDRGLTPHWCHSSPTRYSAPPTHAPPSGAAPRTSSSAYRRSPATASSSRASAAPETGGSTCSVGGRRSSSLARLASIGHVTTFALTEMSTCSTRISTRAARAISNAHNCKRMQRRSGASSSARTRARSWVRGTCASCRA